MLIFVLFAQRKEAYQGEFAPEALEVRTEHDCDEDIQMPELLRRHQSDEYAALDWLTFEVSDTAIRHRLLPAESPIKTKLVDP